MGFLGRINDMFKDNDAYVDEEEENFVAQEETIEDMNTKTENTASPKSTGVGSAAALEMKVVKPDRVDAAFGIADHLMARRTIVINFEETNKETLRRIMDILSGVVFAIKGNIKQVSETTYIVTPKNVDVTSDGDDGADVHSEVKAEPKARELF